jgi:hypothetical protein
MRAKSRDRDMKIYRVNIDTADHGCLVSWHPSKRAADTYIRQWFEDNGEGDPDPRVNLIQQIDIPTDKAGLINWLNVYFTSDNG